MAWNQPYFWPSYEPQFRPQMLNRMPMHRGTSQHPYGSGYQQRSLNPLASVEQQLTRRSLLAAPLPEQQRLYMDFAGNRVHIFLIYHNSIVFVSGPVKLELQYKVNSVAAEVTWNSPGLSRKFRSYLD